jgi:glutamate synthase domain-containing protein 1/glutamate synthase domain-containing protein 3
VRRDARGYVLRFTQDVRETHILNRETTAQRILDSRRDLVDKVDWATRSPDAAEGGCGVLGLACNVPIAGRHVIEAAAQMHNRGNGKGGGIAMAGLDPVQMGVSPETLHGAYLIQIAYLDPDARCEVEEKGLASFDLVQGYRVPTLDDWRAVPGLEVRPPDVWRYFARARPQALDRFAGAHSLDSLSPRAVEDEFVYQNSFRLNQEFYASLGEKRAFVLCHGRDLIVLKIVGYAEQVVQYYQLDDVTARVWIAHQRYPTKGRVWHPGGAHPFVGLNEALVHNGDFANYHAVSEYLRQRYIAPLFLTDTEVSVQLFDLWDRVYNYPLEVTLEALAPTTERDFAVLSPEKQALYRAVQATHMHASPDGPWFFIVARSHPDEGEWQLLGITDTSMLRPQVFALYENASPASLSHAEADAPSLRQTGDSALPSSPPQTGERHGGVKLGLIASERQAINAALRSLAAEDARFLPQADRYWVARGGSHTDGGAFVFTVRTDGPEAASEEPGAGSWTLDVADKFGTRVETATDQRHVDRTNLRLSGVGESYLKTIEVLSYYAFDDGGPSTMLRWATERMPARTYDEIVALGRFLLDFAATGGGEWEFARRILTLLRDRHYDPGDKRRASLLTLWDDTLRHLFNLAPPIDQLTHHASRITHHASRITHHASRITHSTCHALRAPATAETTLVVDTLGFPPEGDASAARLLVAARELGWRHVIAYNWRGGRFAACGLGPQTMGMRVELYGDVGDYAASGLDGAEVHIHGDAQDQVGQILKEGKLVIHGDVGQTFLYGAKGGTIYVQGSAAGRPLINAAGHPRAVINGTCLDYLAESFMAGDPLAGGGFVILNGVTFDEHGRLVELETPYPGGNLFSLASGGAIYLRDPHRKVDEYQLNGGQFAPLSEADWALIRPYLEENERLFGIPVSALLTVNDEERSPAGVYRKIEVRPLTALA